MSRRDSGVYEVLHTGRVAIDEIRLLVNPTALCARGAENLPSGTADNDAPVAAEPPSDPDGLDDSQCSEYLLTIARHHGQVDSEELILNARAGGLAGAVFIAGEHQLLLSLLAIPPEFSR